MYDIKALFLYAWVMLIAGCSHKKDCIIPKLHISFKVDSSKIYPAENIPKSTFMFSPVEQYDKIWVSGPSTLYELDLMTGRWTSLTARFGNIITNQVSIEGIRKDDYTGETYIGCFPEGLIRYYPDKDTFDIIRVQNLATFLPEEKTLVLGTHSGLYLLNKKDNNIRLAENFPIDIRVFSIQKSGTDTLLINHTYYYHIPSKAFGRLFAGNMQAESKSTLTGIGVSLHDYNGDSTIWYYDAGTLIFSKNKTDFYEFKLFPKEYIRQLIADKDYLYILFNDKFVIYNKDYIYKHSVLHNTFNYLTLSRELQQKLVNLYKDTLIFEKYLTNSVALYKNARYSEYPDLRIRVNNLPSNFDFYSCSKKIKNLKAILENDSIPDAFKFNILKGLVRKHTNSLNLDSALVILNIINKNFPDIRDYCVDNSQQLISRTRYYIDSILKEDMPPDKRLFLNAKAMEKLVSGSYWFGEICRNYSIVIDAFKKLLSLFPNSDYADDAEFWIINHNYYNFEPGGYPLEKITSIQKFVDRYPNSALTPKLLINIAQSYSAGDAVNIETRIKNIEKGIAILNYLTSDYKLDSSTWNAVKRQLNEMKKLKSKIVFNLSLKPVKSAYYTDEDIEVEICLSINCSTPQKIRLYKNEVYFTLAMYPESKCSFIPLAVPDTATEVVIIINGEPLRQKIKINRRARHREDGKLGKFCTEGEGLYYINCYSANKAAESDQAKIYIRQ